MKRRIFERTCAALVLVAGLIGTAAAKELDQFTDRLLVNLGKPQIYGANFDFKNGKLVMSPTKDVKNLDRRRKAIGLPPIAEYMKMLEEMYKIPAVMTEAK